MWVAAVCSEMESSEANWRLVSPRATSASISSWRRVRVASYTPAGRCSGPGDLVHLQDRFWAMSSSAAYESAERTTRSLVNAHKASLSITQKVS
jgi:hypothetical protein